MPSRRRFLQAALASAGAWGLDADLAALVARQAACEGAPPGERLGTLPLHGDRPRETPFGDLVGGPGLDARLFTDLSTLEPGRLVTPAAEVFVRTAAPPALPPAGSPWPIAVAGPVANVGSLSSAQLAAEARPMGTHLIECAGNNNPDNFGLMSAAEWSGVPLAELVAQLGPSPGAAGILVSGLDDETSASWRSVPGASWVIPLARLEQAGAFLATSMNGAPLTRDHGAPVRLVVPGWYGCSWIKWVRELRLVGADEPLTSQMVEFARRTHQQGSPTRALDYEPPVIDLAATPVRVERWRVAGQLEYRVIGIVWGGTQAAAPLEIRFDARDGWRKLDVCPPRADTRTWSLWTYRWRPDTPGTYNIALRCPDRSVRTRRLDLFFYTRRVIIDAV